MQFLLLLLELLLELLNQQLLVVLFLVWLGRRRFSHHVKKAVINLTVFLTVGADEG